MTRAFVLALLASGVATAVQVQGAAAQPGVAGDRYGAYTAPAGYGPSSYAPIAYTQATPVRAPAALRGRVLSWPGKSTPVAVQAAASSLAPAAVVDRMAPRQPWSARYAQRAPPQSAGPLAPPPRTYGSQTGGYRGASSPAYAPTTYAPAAYAPPAYAPAAYAPQPYAGRSVPVGMAAPVPGGSGAAQDGWRPVYAAASSAAPAPAPALSGAPRAAAPSSIYASPDGYSPAAAAGRAPPPLRTASADRRYGYDPTVDHSVRFYSVHRPFGIRPDPAPIPPQFFTATADLADPPGPLPTDHTTVASGTTRTARTTAAATDAGAQ